RKCRRDGARPVSTLAGTACQNKPDEAQPRPNNGAFQQGAIYRAPTATQTNPANLENLNKIMVQTVVANNHKNQQNHPKITVQTTGAAGLTTNH
ncbi:MAG: hypothetical protein LBD59_01300, partial [Prevotellaceae bacterium]|nr:hypothetical protein [Prevotellaceae bacterium]